MTGMKARRFDFYFDDWLTGTMGLDMAERGIYITAIAAMGSHGAPIPQDELRRLCPCDLRVYRKAVSRLIASGKLRLSRGYLSNKRCITEVQHARKRMISASEKGRKGGRKPNEINEINKPEPNLRVKPEPKLPSPSPSPSPKGEAKEEEPKLEPSESAAAREGFSKSEKGLGRYAPSEPPPPDTVKPADAQPPTEEEKAEVAALVEQATAALTGSVPKGIRDPVAYAATVKESKFKTLATKVGAWVGTALDGPARWAAWEVMAEVGEVGARSELMPASRKSFDQLVAMYRAAAGSEAKEAA